MDPITLIGSWLATFSFQEFILGRCKEHLEEAPEKGALALLKRFSEKRNVGSLPQNHDLELAGHEALKEATRALLLGIHAQLDPKPPLFEAIRNHLQNGTLTTQPLIELRSSRSREWFNAFQKLCDDETSFARLTRKAEPLESNPVAKFGGHVDESAERELHQRFSEWLDHEMQNTPGRPDFIDDFLHKGWPVEKDGRERVALYQAWCLFFREKLKHKPEVFRILVIDTLTEVAANVKELSALAIQQPSINDFHTWIGLRLGALQAWLKGEFDRVHDKLDDHGQLLYAIKEQTANPPRAIPKGKPNNLSFGSIGSLFKGRDADLEKIHAHLQTKRPLVIYGLGGVGKTRLTIEYALKHSEEYSALLSVGASSPDVLYRNLAALYAVLALPEPAPIEQDVQCQAVLHWLNDHPGWLLLLDNADSKHAADAVETVLPRLRAGNVIVTSRISQWSKAVDTLPLEELLPSAATEFLLDATKGKRVISATDNADAATLASDLGYLALALEQATAYVETKRISLATYRARWQEREANVRSWFDPRSMQYPKSIVFAWDATFEQLSPTAQSLLRMLCWLAPDAIPRSLLETEEANKILADLVPETTNHHNAMEDALAELAGFSLLKWDYDSTSFRIHRLVQEVTQDQIESAHRTVYIGAALNTLNNARPSDPPPNDVRSWPIWEPLRLHVEAVVRVADVAQIAEPTSYLMNELGILLYTKCVWGQAEALPRDRRSQVRRRESQRRHPPQQPGAVAA